MVLLLKLFVTFTLLLSATYALPLEVEKALKKSGLSKEEVSLYIQEIGASQPLVTLHPDTLRRPASVIKVLTTYASLLKFGFSYRIPTSFYRVGKMTHGVLHGDLAIKAMGDPTLNSEDIEQIAKALAKRGLRKITGDLLIDRSYFDVGSSNNSHFDKHTYSPYNAMPDAMMFNERISRIYVTPNKKSVVKKRADQSYKVVDNLQLVNKKCRGKYSWPQLKVDNSHEKPWLIFHGKISQKCGRRTISKVVTQPYKSLYYGLREALKKEGITLQGGLRLAPLPPRAKRFYTHFSDTLEKIVSTTAKKSNNLYARHLMLLLGAKCYGAPATLEKGRRAVKHTLESYGIVSKEPYFIDNGCGLSRKATLSARFLSSLFIHAFKHDGKRWMRTLSIAGVDGTIRKRFRGTKVAKHAWMKTGTLNHAKNIGGYVQSKEGKYYTVVILVNSKKGNWRASFLENEVIKWVRSYHTPKPTPSVVPKEKNVTQAPLSEALF